MPVLRLNCRPRALASVRSQNVYQYTWDAVRVSALVFGGYCGVKLAWELAYEAMPDAFRSAELAKASGERGLASPPACRGCVARQGSAGDCRAFGWGNGLLNARVREEDGGRLVSV